MLLEPELLFGDVGFDGGLDPPNGFPNAAKPPPENIPKLNSPLCGVVSSCALGELGISELFEGTVVGGREVLFKLEKISPIPTLLYGKEFWQPLIDIVHNLHYKYKTISELDEQFLKVIDNPKDLLQHLK